jgi:chorismate-pyruvate lyase
MSSLDILGALEGIDPGTIDPLPRILLITDGTLTEILEAAFLERIRLVKIDQRVVSADESHASLTPDPSEKLLARKILLQGETSGRNYAYAESVIAFERLNPAFRDELLNSDIPLGRLWLTHKLETYKELREVRCSPANDLHRYFECAETALLLCRTYFVFSAGRVVMVVTEHFPIKYSGGPDAQA